MARVRKRGSFLSTTSQAWETRRCPVLEKPLPSDRRCEEPILFARKIEKIFWGAKKVFFPFQRIRVSWTSDPPNPQGRLSSDSRMGYPLNPRRLVEHLETQVSPSSKPRESFAAAEPFLRGIFT